MGFWDWVNTNPGWAVISLIILMMGLEAIILAFRGK